MVSVDSKIANFNEALAYFRDTLYPGFLSKSDDFRVVDASVKLGETLISSDWVSAQLDEMSPDGSVERFGDYLIEEFYDKVNLMADCVPPSLAKKGKSFWTNEYGVDAFLHDDVKNNSPTARVRIWAKGGFQAREPHAALRLLDQHRVNGLNEQLTVEVLDGPGAGGACHHYQVRTDNGYKSDILFQRGPIKENGVNGISNEALLAVLIDRLEGFQSGDFACHDNQVALDHLQSARLWLHKRTLDRVARGVEGTNAR